MKKILFTCTVLGLAVWLTACVTRMAPFSPHRANTEAHQKARTNQDCSSCHAVAEIGKEHKVSDNCVRCHRIVQGD